MKYMIKNTVKTKIGVNLYYKWSSYITAQGTFDTSTDSYWNI